VESEGSGKSGIPIHPIRRTKIKRRKNSGFSLKQPEKKV